MIYMDVPRPCTFKRYNRTFQTTAHLFSDIAGPEGTKELNTVVRNLGMKVVWVQDAGTYREHYDLFDGRIPAAGHLGVPQVSQRKMVEIIRSKI